MIFSKYVLLLYFIKYAQRYTRMQYIIGWGPLDPVQAPCSYGSKKMMHMKIDIYNNST